MRPTCPRTQGAATNRVSEAAPDIGIAFRRQETGDSRTSRTVKAPPVPAPSQWTPRTAPTALTIIATVLWIWRTQLAESSLIAGPTHAAAAPYAEANTVSRAAATATRTVTKVMSTVEAHAGFARRISSAGATGIAPRTTASTPRAH